ncbi:MULTISPECIES: hypothetical protein [Bacillus cereus group]|uniref:hypothetical protein n=1 Tax=Bacillus cereus group TaxID=86661 RepID=UPI0018F3E86C|nr:MULTISPECIES: hypothetical protein [Bacillus cereus group]MBJ8096353.1 hypothetical protein [Bacillus cereus]CAH2466023.1 hypothetical protein ACOSJ1_EBGNOMHC_05789 [Bacillus mycoides KBAB4]
MFNKRKIFILVFLITLIVSVFPISSTYAARQIPRINDWVMDSKGKPIVAGKKYILLTDQNYGGPNFGLSYETSARTHYPIVYTQKKYYDPPIKIENIDYYGTPVIFYLKDGNNANPAAGNRRIGNTDKISMYMTGINKYIKAPDRGWISFTSNKNDASFMTVEKTGPNKVRLHTGKADFYHDAQGKHTDWYGANDKNSYKDADTYFTVQQSFLAGSDNNKMWGLSWRYPTYNYYFVPVEN